MQKLDTILRFAQKQTVIDLLFLCKTHKRAQQTDHYGLSKVLFLFLITSKKSRYI